MPEFLTAVITDSDFAIRRHHSGRLSDVHTSIRSLTLDVDRSVFSVEVQGAANEVETLETIWSPPAPHRVPIYFPQCAMRVDDACGLVIHDGDMATIDCAYPDKEPFSYEMLVGSPDEPEAAPVP
ncbi:MAG: hypothetical protein R3F61_17655 [Myxococcota bacterium]